jgi:uncharacterized damage-inducible protein DinB
LTIHTSSPSPYLFKLRTRRDIIFPGFIMNWSERKPLLESYESAYKRLNQTLATIPEEALHYKPEPSEWSIQEIVLHLADSEANLYVRARRIIAEPGSKVLAFDHDRWTKTLGYHKQSFKAALELFRYLRELTYELLSDQPEKVWKNTVEHSEYGVMTLDQWLERADKHANEHIGQIKANFTDWLKHTRKIG